MLTIELVEANKNKEGDAGQYNYFQMSLGTIFLIDFIESSKNKEVRAGLYIYVLMSGPHICIKMEHVQAHATYALHTRKSQRTGFTYRAEAVQ